MQNNLPSLPRIEKSKVFHVGTLVAADKGRRGLSCEGTGLSVSENPRAWVKIARLGGLPTWELCLQKASFVDAHQLSKEEHEALARWGVEVGWVSRSALWEVTFFDYELDRRCSMTFSSEAAAREEYVSRVGLPANEGAPEGLDDAAEDEPENEEDVTLRVRRDGLVATRALDERMGFAVPAALVPDLLLTVYAQDATDAIGVWFSDDLDIPGLSAPRGVIFESTLARWAVRQTEAAC